ncbi:MAG: ribosomal protein L23 [Parcubacteria bacterium C7867-007]|nr:MAG: ribosomal protein L23 [Parcubacteria bacterium C7867-007]
MPLFSSDTKKSKKESVRSKQPVSKNDDGRLANVLIAPWLSEKALLSSGSGVYVFQIPADATKLEVAAAVEKIYKVTPRKVHVANLPAKSVSLRTRRGTGTRARRHKAYVYLAKGDSIEF